MSDRLPDFLESMESAAEARMDEATAGLPDGKFRCCCGRIGDLDSANPVSANPYAMPVCDVCFGEWEATL